MNDKLLSYFNGDELATSVWLQKYAQEGEETPDDMHRRLAREFARVELNYQITEPLKNSDLESHKNRLKKLSKYGQTRRNLDEETIYHLFKDFKYIIPQGSIMSQLGAKSIGSLSNCFVIGQPEDSYGGIFRKDEEMVQLMKRRGGVGIDISTLRPKETSVSNAAKTTTGAVSFMHRYSNSTREVAQNGRRGALMLSISINHPDVMDFIKIKRDGTSVTGANISIKINDDFMKAVENDEDYLLRFPCTNTNKELDVIFKWEDTETPYNELVKLKHLDGNTNMSPIYVKKIKAREYWEEIIKSAHGYAEPGIIFENNHHDYSPDGVYPQFKGVTTNPCGEIFMGPYDACRLIAVNYLSFIKNPFTKDAEFDREKFYEVIYEAMRISDDLIDLEIEHIDRIIKKILKDPESKEVKRRELELWENVYKTAKASRRTGLGFTALGDMLAAMGYKYDSEEALLFVEQIEHIKMEASLDCTTDMAITRGTFEGWNPELEFPTSNSENKMYGNGFYYFLQTNFKDQTEKMKKYGRRNVSWSTVAPTGTVSLLTQTTSGIEPVFKAFYTRRKKVNKSTERVDFIDELGDKWQEFSVLHPKFKDWVNYHKLFRSGTDVSQYNKEQLQKWFEESPWYGSEADDINWTKRVELQGIVQKYTTHSISSTINLPSDVTEEEVGKIYMESWKKGLKGVTVYRDGSRSGVLVTETKDKELVTFNENHAPKRPKSLISKVVRFNNNKEKWIAFVGLMDNKPYEVFTGQADNVELPLSVEVGEIKKVKSEDGTKRYDFLYDGGTVENISGVSSKDYWNYGKLISSMLRHGMPLPFVVDTIQGLTWDNDNINTWKAGMARALKKFIKDGKVEGVKCTDCGSENIVFQEGCLSCKDCGSSKCG